MLDIYICCSDSKEACYLKDICLKYLFQRNFDAEIYVSDNSDKIENQETSLYIIEYAEEFFNCAIKVRQRNSQNYIVALVDDMIELSDAVIPSVRLSGFLMRPVSVEKAFALFNAVCFDYSETQNDVQVFRFKIKAREYSVPSKKIVLFESNNKKIIVRTETQEFECYDTLENILSLLPGNFVRVHKSFIVNTDRISSVDYGALTVYMDDGTQAYISRTYKNELKEKLGSDAAM